MSEEAALLEVDVQLEFSDYLRFQYFDSLNRLWWTIPFFLLGAMVSAVLFVVSAYYQDSYMLRDLVPFASLVFLGGIFLFAGPYLTSKREFEVNPALRQVIHYRLLEKQLESISPRRTGKLPWSKVREVRETGSAFFIYADGAYILPKREFTGEAEISSMRELLMVILGERKCRFKLDRITSRF